MTYSVRVLRAVQNGQELFLFFLPAETLKALPIQVEKFDPDKPYDHPEQGYQRSAERNRARRFARYLEVADATSPTAIMLNDRDEQTRYDAKEGVLVFDTDSGPIFNYDGQHRQLGYQFRLEAEESFAKFPIPVVMTRGMDKVKEMTQFRTINSTAKGVATSLVNAILANLHATEGDEAIEVSEHRNVVCYKVAEALNNDPQSPWHQLIALPNQSQWTKRAVAEDPTREHTRVIRANSFVDALRPVYDYLSQVKMGDSLDTRAEEIGAIVNEFWSALKEKMPDAFGEPNKYALFKSNGVGPVHLVLRDLMFKMHGAHRKWIKSEFLIMTEGSDLLGNCEFWDLDNEDGARNYSGKAGWSDLAKRIIRDISEGALPPYEPARGWDGPRAASAQGTALGITRGARTHLRVTLDGGTVIEEHQAAHTFATVLGRLGLSKVEALGITVRNLPLVGDLKSTEYGQTEMDGKYICTHSSTKEKKETLELIGKKLGTPLKVEIIGNE